MTNPALLVDTNVWLDVVFGSSGSSPAVEFFSIARSEGARMGIASHSLKDVYYLLQRRLKLLDKKTGAVPPERSAPAARVAAWAAVSHIMEFAEVVGSDYSDACLAAKHRTIHDDFEDDLVIAAALRMKADLLVTSDRVLIGHSPVAALTPADAAHWLQATVPY